jgi:tetratricopeptide (TPR) repeat protein
MRAAVIIVLNAFVLTTASYAQIPQTFENLQVLPKDIPRAELIQVMRGFASDLGVRCQYCHVVPPGANASTLQGMDFKSDDKVEKKKAREMMKMVRTINNTLLTSVPSRSSPPVNVQCYTCHRLSPVPKTLERVLTETLDKEGIDSTVVRYRQLRERTLVQGRFNFADYVLNNFAQDLAAAGKPAEAIRLLELNQEFYPQAGHIDFLVGEIHRTRGEKDQAIARYRKALEKTPDHPQAGRRLQEVVGQ